MYNRPLMQALTKIEDKYRIQVRDAERRIGHPAKS